MAPRMEFVTNQERRMKFVKFIALVMSIKQRKSNSQRILQKTFFKNNFLLTNNVS